MSLWRSSSLSELTRQEALVKLESNELVTHDQGQTEEESKLRRGLETSA